jgi:menaquinone-9 beta-reductase
MEQATMPRISPRTSVKAWLVLLEATAMNTLSGVDSHYDVVIVGARCAGAATALLLARSGAKVLVVDGQAYGSDAMSTHALMRGAVLQLERWGLTRGVVAADTPLIRSTTFHYSDEAIRVDIKPDHGVDCLFAPRRTVLDPLLVDTAREAGAEVRHGIALSGLQFALGGRVVGATLKDANGACMTVRSDIVIGADGRQSTVAQLVNAEAYVEGSHASGIVFGYFENLDREGLHWHFAKNHAAGVIPTNSGHCVFAAVPAARFREIFRGDVMRGFLKVLRSNSPELRADVDRADLIGRLRGFGGATSYLRQCHGAGWALVGDAGYFKDPLTAHGITDALRDAQLLSRRVVEGSALALETYQRERDALSLPFLRVTDAIASFSWDLDELKQLHSELSQVMRAEANYIASQSQLPLSQHRRTKMSIESPWTRTLAGRPAVGARAQRSRSTTMRDVEMFTEMTGDKNPIHYDAELATRSPFNGLIVQGGITTGLLNAVVAEDLPGPGTVFLETNWRFVKAVRVGETITASVKVEQVRDEKPICKLETVVCNADGDTCVVGTATTYTVPLLRREN